MDSLCIVVEALNLCLQETSLGLLGCAWAQQSSYELLSPFIEPNLGKAAGEFWLWVPTSARKGTSSGCCGVRWEPEFRDGLS